MGRRRISGALENVGDVKLLSLEIKKHSYLSRQAMRREMMDGIFVGHHERTGASLFLSERGLLIGTTVQRRPRTSNGTANSSESAEEFPWRLT